MSRPQLNLRPLTDRLTIVVGSISPFGRRTVPGISVSSRKYCRFSLSTFLKLALFCQERFPFEFIFLYCLVANTGDNLGIGAYNVKQIARTRWQGDVSPTGCLWPVLEYTATSDDVFVYSVVSFISLFRRFLRIRLRWRIGNTSPSLRVPLSGVTATGSMVCAYQNQIPPALMVLSYGGFPERSRSLAESVWSTLESVLFTRDNEGETVASKSRLATITNSRTSTRTVIAVICLMVQLSSDDACEARSISSQQLCRLFR